MIKPPWAASIWADSDFIYAELPALNGAGKAHTIKFTHSTKGISQLLVMIQARSQQSHIGSKGSPTQAQVLFGIHNKPKRRQGFPISIKEHENVLDVLKQMGMVK